MGKKLTTSNRYISVITDIYEKLFIIFELTGKLLTKDVPIPKILPMPIQMPILVKMPIPMPCRFRFFDYYVIFIYMLDKVILSGVVFRI